MSMRKELVEAIARMRETMVRLDESITRFEAVLEHHFDGTARSTRPAVEQLLQKIEAER